MFLFTEKRKTTIMDTIFDNNVSIKNIVLTAQAKTARSSLSR